MFVFPETDYSQIQHVFKVADLARVGYNFAFFLLAHLYFIYKLEIVRVHACRGGEMR